jgi:3-hydroxypropanoate dehydrogenase
MQDVTTPHRIDDTALRQIFLDARTHNKWQPQDVPDSLLREIVDVLKMGPTSANCSPARNLFLKSKAKERLKPYLDETNKEKTMQAPVCAIIGYDLKFYEHLPKLFPHKDAKAGSKVSRNSSRRRPSVMARCKVLI